MLWLPTKNITVNASIINTTDSSTDTGFEDFGDGQTVSVEADLQYRLRGLPGGMNVGGLYSFKRGLHQARREIDLSAGPGAGGRG